MSLEKVVRTPDEIKELAQECLEHEQGGSKQFEHLSYEAGIRAALRWMHFSNERYPLDAAFSPPRPAKVEDGRDYMDGVEV